MDADFLIHYDLFIKVIDKYTIKYNKYIYVKNRTLKRGCLNNIP